MNERTLTDLETCDQLQSERSYEAPRVESFDLNEVVRFTPGSTVDGFGGFQA